MLFHRINCFPGLFLSSWIRWTAKTLVQCSYGGCSQSFLNFVELQRLQHTCILVSRLRILNYVCLNVLTNLQGGKEENGFLKTLKVEFSKKLYICETCVTS